MRRTTFVAVGVAAMLGVVAVGCGDDDEDEGSASSSGAAQTETGGATPSKKPAGPAIKIGALGSYTGPEAPSLGAMDESIKAWAAYTNANGGINGHPVEIVVEDDQTNPTTAKRVAQKLITQDKVMAIVGQGSIVTSAWAKTATAAGVPVIGSTDFQQEFLTEPLFFPSGTQSPTVIYGLLQDAKKAGLKKLGVLPCQEAEVCVQLAGLMKGISSVVGIEFVFDQKITVAQPNYNAVCLAAKNAGVDGLITLENAATVVRLANDCAKQGYKPKHLNILATAGSAWEDEPNMEGALSTHSNAVPSAASVPEIKTFNEALDQYAPDVKGGEQFNVIDAGAWAGGQVFKLAAEKAKLTPTSKPADVLKGLYQIKEETLGGLTPPLTYVKGKPSFTTCWFPQTIKDQKFAAANGGKAECIPAADLPKLQKVLAG